MESSQDKQVTQGQARQTPPNVISVSNRNEHTFYVNLGKYRLNDHGKIEIHALGQAISKGVEAADNLVK